MKTKSKNQKNSELKNRPEQLSTGNAIQARGRGEMPFISLRERETNRRLPVQQVLKSLERWMPAQRKLAKVAGNIISIQFPEAPVRRVRQELAEFGFSWNEKRNAWQHFGGVTFQRSQNVSRSEPAKETGFQRRAA
jgi:hypothetical protein